MKRRTLIQSSLAGAVAAALPTGPAAAMGLLTNVQGDLAAVTGAGQSVSIESAAVRELGEALRGHLLLPGNPGYDTARRVLNIAIDRHPALIVQPTGAADISLAVQFARERNLLTAVKCGGHSWSGKSTCDGGLQIDLSHYRYAHVDPRSRRAYVAGGSLLGEMDHESMAHGLVTTAGTVSHTGVGGLTLAGGFGRVARRFGLALDNVRSVDIVTADGVLRHASEEENPDLFWAVRGGGGNFGVVTQFEFQLHPMDRNVIAGSLVYPIGEVRNLLNFYSQYMHEAPNELYLDFAVVPGAEIASMNVCYSGPASNAERVLAPIRKAGTVIADQIAEADYVAVQRSQDTTEARVTGEYLKSGFINGISPELVDEYVDTVSQARGVVDVYFFQHGGGAIAQVAPDATAFHWRENAGMMAMVTSWPMAESGQEKVRKLKALWSQLAPHTAGWYTVEVSDESPEVVNRNYGANYPRLVQAKNKYDPTNLFRLNANVQPTV